MNAPKDWRNYTIAVLLGGSVAGPVGTSLGGVTEERAREIAQEEDAHVRDVNAVHRRRIEEKVDSNGQKIDAVDGKLDDILDRLPRD